MKLINISLPSSHQIYLISDLHIGSSLCSIKKIESLINKIKKEKNSKIIILGDLIEAICVDDPRFDIDTTESPNLIKPINQILYVKDLLSSIANKIICILQGNHEYKLKKFGNLIEKLLCEPLKIQYGTYSCKISIFNKNKLIYKIFATHGYKQINSTADDPLRRETNMKLQLKRHLQHKAGDCEIMCMGHTHKLLIVPPIQPLYLTDDGTHIITKEIPSFKTQNELYIPPEHRWYINTGSFLKLYKENVSGYGEIFGFDPIELGCAKIIVKNNKIKNILKITTFQEN